MPAGGMDSEYSVDVEEILGVVRTAEVIIFRFLIISQRLLVDARFDREQGPLLKLVPAARSAEERFRSLRELRPGFKLPERITIIHWPKFVDRLEESGVWSGIERRVLAAGFEETETAVAGALAELKRHETDAVRRAIRGDGYQTLWEA